MAALLLRLGRTGSLKCLQRESRAALRWTPTVTFATNVEEPKKSGKKPKTAAVEGADEQGLQLASKTLVAFPCKVVLPAGQVVQALGSSSPGQGPSATHQADAPSTNTASVSLETVTSESTRLAEAEVEVEAVTSAGASEPGIVTKSTGTKITETIAKAPLNEDGTSGSSSSSSDSDSDSESDDEKEEGKAKPWADPTKKPEGAVAAPCDAVSGDKTHSPGSSQSPLSSAAADVLLEITPGASSEFTLTAANGVTSKAQSEEPSSVRLSSVKVAEEKSCQSGVKEAVPFSGTSADASSRQITAMSSKKLGDPVPVVATPKNSAAPGAGEGSGKGAAPGAGKGAGKGAAPGAGKGAGKGAAPGAGKGAGKGAAPGAGKGAGKGANPGAGKGAGKGAAPGAGKGVASSEQLMDPAPVLSDAAGKEMKPEAEVEALQSPDAAAPSPPEPEPEPFDNSTYKNLQHHSYHQYTFVDMEVEMAKYRLPQPSSGRPSPRH